MKKYQGTDLSDYKSSYLECRIGMSGHRWVWKTDFKIVRNGKGQIIEFSRLRRCTRCSTEVAKVYDGGTGHIIKGGAYKYPDGYQIDSQKFKADRGDPILEALRRSLNNGRVEEE